MARIDGRGSEEISPRIVSSNRQRAYEETTEGNKIDKGCVRNDGISKMYAPTKEKEKWNQLFISMGYIDKKKGVVYADLTGKFPITLMNGMTAIFIMYD